MGLGDPCNDPLEIIAFQPVKCFDNDNWNHKSGTLSAIFQNAVGEVNTYVRFELVTYTIFNSTLWQVSVSINANSVYAR